MMSFCYQNVILSKDMKSKQRLYNRRKYPLSINSMLSTILSPLLLSLITITFADIVQLGPTTSLLGTPLYGIAYNPNRRLNQCQPIENIDQDLLLLKPIANSIRTYAAGCNHEYAILKSASKYDMGVYYGLWVSKYDQGFEEQLGFLVSALKQLSKKESKSLKGVIVGNEAIYRQDQTVDQIVLKIKRTKKILDEFGLSVQVSTSDVLQYYFEPSLLENIDFFIRILNLM